MPACSPSASSRKATWCSWPRPSPNSTRPRRAPPPPRSLLQRPAPAAPAAAAAPAAPAADLRTAPSAARLAAEQGVDLNSVAGTGRGGVISKPDVIAAAEAAANKPAAAAPPAAPASPVPPVVNAVQSRPSGTRETREKMTTRRKRIAENLLQAQHATAHLTTFNEIDMSVVSAFRERMKEKVEKEQGVKLSFMPFFAKAACMALKAYPIVNAQLDGDSVIYKHYVNLGIAVASDAGS
jgi:2-oxoglutarate dehydrogenase E2 component (dihydrolipoamide succinyltransferase)